MASIFTYEPDQPRVASPWLTPTESFKTSTLRADLAASTPVLGHIADYGFTRLQPEPQEGPTEYKLHLLLRPRRIYSSSSTGKSVSGSQQREQQSGDHSTFNEPAPFHKASKNSRQNRLQSLTTQLLWRLQQSSPYHASSTSELVLPKLPEAVQILNAPSKPGKLLAGLEESRGALYEIGVSDDGTFVGLTKDEMDESLKNLIAMAASLGCNVQLIRMIVVGECEWYESLNVQTNEASFETYEPQVLKLPDNSNESAASLRHQEQLWVAEALITPDLSSRTAITPTIGTPTINEENPLQTTQVGEQLTDDPPAVHAFTEQLRITLTGPTTSGKSSLLGTLSTATLDNGRGKSRLSLLKHRHEIASGVTSSVAQELIGYKSGEVINYAFPNVSSWTDMHASAEGGRLVFLSDSAGHPRYRRTTVRGLVGWAPHWTVLCVAADDGKNARSVAGGTSSAQDVLGIASGGVDLAKAHLELCLKLDKPLAVVITKLDLASKTSLRQILSKILSIVKAGGRIPSLIPPDTSKYVLASELGTIPAAENENVRKTTDKFKSIKSGGLTSIVPIILTSAAKGIGIRSMHALLQNLPISPRPTSDEFIGPVLNPEQPVCLFHIEDVFELPASYENLASNNGKGGSGVVVAGHLRFGRLSVGDSAIIGPFPADPEKRDSTPENFYSRSPNSFGASLSHPSATEISASVTKGEWHNVYIVSIRNLRLPVHTLDAGQVGTIGVIFNVPLGDDVFEHRPIIPRIRKGMVMGIPSRHMIQTGHTLQAASGLTASFEDGDINSVTPGSLVVIYIASVRSTARVLHLSANGKNDDGYISEVVEPDDDVFDLEGLDEEEEAPVIFGFDGVTDVTFELITHREWIELGSQVLVMPGGGTGLYTGSERGQKGVAGLEGFVGKVIEVVD